MVRIIGIFLEGFFIPGELLYLKAVSDSCQTLPDPGKLAHVLKVFIFRFFENTRGSERPPILVPNGFSVKTQTETGRNRAFSQRKCGCSFLFAFLKAPIGRGLLEPVCLQSPFMPQ